MKTLRGLSTEALLVLFTPPVPPTSGSSRATDPLESFGQALSQYHKRIRHVPFVPKVGLTDTHLAWIRRANAIVIINCEALSDSKDTNTDDSLANQVGFTSAVSEAINSMRADADDVPFSCVYCGTKVPPPLTNYDNLLHCPTYSNADLEHAARLLLGDDG